MADAARTTFPAFPSLKFFLYYCTYVQYSQAYFPSSPYPRCCMEGARMAPAMATYEPCDPSRTVLYTVIADHLETFLASCKADSDAKGSPAYGRSWCAMSGQAKRKSLALRPRLIPLSTICICAASCSSNPAVVLTSNCVLP